MDIRPYINNYVKLSHRGKPFSKIFRSLLTGDKPYSLCVQYGFPEAENLNESIPDSVKVYSNNKDNAIALYKDFVNYLKRKGVDVPYISFPEIPVSNSFERLMFIAKYLQDSDHKISELPKLLWVSERQIQDDLLRLRGEIDPIQVCGKTFSVPDSTKKNGTLSFASTAHPVFLAENLTQILVMLKGLKMMSENPLYKPYAESSAREIWAQLSDYAKDRIKTILSDVMPEDYTWYTALSETEDYLDEEHFHTEKYVSSIRNDGPSVLLDCLKNGTVFSMEYQGEDGIHIYKDCLIEEGSYRDKTPGIVVNCSEGKIRILIEHVLKSAYTVEELI